LVAGRAEKQAGCEWVLCFHGLLLISESVIVISTSKSIADHAA
jgi:hypothetical protein